MRILLDHNTPAPLRYFLIGHHVETAYERGWAELSNGELLRMAEGAGFEVLITTDKGIRHQQNLAGRKLALAVLSTNDWTRIRKWKSIVVERVSSQLVLLAASIGKFGGCAVAARAHGISWRESAAVGVMMNTRGLMELVVVNIGYDLGIIPRAVFFMLVLMAVTTTYITLTAVGFGVVPIPDSTAPTSTG